MPNFSGPWRCRFVNFPDLQTDPRGTMDFTHHIDSHNNITDAPYVDQDGDRYYVSGRIYQYGPLWLLELARTDHLVEYHGLLVDYQDDDTMAFAVLKNPVSDKRAKEAKRDKLFEQVEEPWVITKP